MFYMEEFEVYESNGMFIAVPFDFDGGTQGESLREASEMAWDWMKTELEYRMMEGEEIPPATIGNEPTHDGGRVVLIALNVSLSEIETVSATKAAQMLGLSKGRVSQLFKAGQLAGYKSGRDLMITVDSVKTRLSEAKNHKNLENIIEYHS